MTNRAGPVGFFRYGEGSDPAFMIAGGLIFDTGEAERTFFYRCQDRFLAYCSLSGWQCLWFAVDDAHVDRYLKLLTAFRLRFDSVVARCGVFPQAVLKEPLFFLLDPKTMAITPSRRLRERLADPSARAHLEAGVALNQISPSYARFLGEMARVLGECGLPVNWPIARAEKEAGLALRLQDKAIFLEQAAKRVAASPFELPTAVVSEAEFRAATTWGQLAHMFEARTGHTAAKSFFLKTNRNTSGNVSSRIGVANFGERHAAFCAALDRERSDDPAILDDHADGLAAEIAANPALRSHPFRKADLVAMMAEQARARHDLQILIQPDLHHARSSDAPVGYGLSFMIHADQSVSPFVVNAQLYRDAERKHFLGGYLSPQVEERLAPEALGLCAGIASDIAGLGYRGPVNFDLLEDRNGALRFVYDCNPRLTGIFPSLAVRWALGPAQAEEPVVSSGYRGEVRIPDFDWALSRLDAAGLLITESRRRGVALLPNLSADDGCDAHLVGYELEETLALLARGGPLEQALGTPLSIPET